VHLKSIARNTGLLQRFGDGAFLHSKVREEQVLGANEIVAQRFGFFFGERE
jgi:hypothetical protein